MTLSERSVLESGCPRAAADPQHPTAPKICHLRERESFDTQRKRRKGHPPCQEGKQRSKVRHSLETLGGIIAEAAKVYREMRDNKLDHNQGRSLVWVLSQLRAMVETQALERLEERLNELAPNSEARNGYPRTNRTSAATH